jgi:hypothetical protein
MSIQQIPTILIAYPKNFSCYGKFDRKVSNILSSLSAFHLAIVIDYNEFISRCFLSDSRLQDAPTHIDEKHINGITHAIIFSDGESYSSLIENTKKAGIKSRIIDAEITKVVNIDKGEKHDTYIGRGSKWGNPYVIGIDGDRDEVIQKFKYDFDGGFLKFSKEEVHDLKGKSLGCHCHPAACHGDVIAKYLNTLDDGE